MRDLNKRVDRLEAAAPRGGCRDPFHQRWFTVHQDVETGAFPDAPRCPSCGRPAEENLIVICYDPNWRDDVDRRDLRRLTIKTLRGVSMDDL